MQYLSENRIKQVDSSEVAKMPALNYLGFLLSMDFPYTLLLIIPSLMIIALATLEKEKYCFFMEWPSLKTMEKYSIKISSILFTVGLVSYLSIFLSVISAFFKMVWETLIIQSRLLKRDKVLQSFLFLTICREA